LVCRLIFSTVVISFCMRGDARGLEVSPGGLLQNQLVQRGGSAF
jgi:hypothetical protein